ncbi:hypothetical protein [Streptococcus hyovaginalis]|uniref:hypothetical protein n=1 Tax=Streptococcus hyovaginalis TaxID=149015 RepID=UPI001478A191|nr:hypothetical protein [Streptococcus hyovaginalis]
MRKRFWLLFLGVSLLLVACHEKSGSSFEKDEKPVSKSEMRVGPSKSTSTLNRANSSDSSTEVYGTSLSETVEMVVEEIHLDNFDSIQGMWTNGSESVDIEQQIIDAKSLNGTAVEKKVQDGYLSYTIIPKMGLRYGYYFLPSGVSSMNLEGAAISNEDDISKDRILVMHERYGSFYYRETDATTLEASVKKELENFMISFRDAVNDTIKTKKDHIAALYVSTENPAYKETLAWYMAVKEPYQNVSTRFFDKMIK